MRLNGNAYAGFSCLVGPSLSLPVWLSSVPDASNDASEEGSHVALATNHEHAPSDDEARSWALTEGYSFLLIR